MSTMNRIANAGNRFQGSYKRVLCVCSAGLLRSPTAALVLSQEPFNFNTRSVGYSQEYALIPLDSAHLHWADEIVTMETAHTVAVKEALEKCGLANSIKVLQLDIPDNYGYRDKTLIGLITKRYTELSKGG